MVGKKGFIRIVEATIAIVLILGAILILRNGNSETEDADFTETLSEILNEIARNESLRENIVKNDSNAKEQVIFIIKDRINNAALNYSVRICELLDNCELENFPENAEGDIYSAERVIGASIEEPEFKPKKIRIFLWRIRSS